MLFVVLLEKKEKRKRVVLKMKDDEAFRNLEQLQSLTDKQGSFKIGTVLSDGTVKDVIVYLASKGGSYTRELERKLDMGASKVTRIIKELEEIKAIQKIRIDEEDTSTLTNIKDFADADNTIIYAGQLKFIIDLTGPYKKFYENNKSFFMTINTENINRSLSENTKKLENLYRARELKEQRAKEENTKEQIKKQSEKEKNTCVMCRDVFSEADINSINFELLVKNNPASPRVHKRCIRENYQRYNGLKKQYEEILKVGK